MKWQHPLQLTSRGTARALTVHAWFAHRAWTDNRGWQSLELRVMPLIAGRDDVENCGARCDQC